MCCLSLSLFLFVVLTTTQTKYSTPGTNCCTCLTQPPGCNLFLSEHNFMATSCCESKFLKNLARGQEGGPQAKLPGAYCGIFKDRYSPQTKSIFRPSPFPISFQGGPRNEIKNRVKNQVLNE